MPSGTTPRLGLSLISAQDSIGVAFTAANSEFNANMLILDGAGGLSNPMTSIGDLIVGGAAGAPQRLGIGTTGQVLTVSGGTAVWAAAPPPSGAAGGDLTGTYPNPTLVGTANVNTIVRANRLDQMAAPAAAVALNAQKITGLANGTAATDGAAFGQIPTTLPPSGAAGGALLGTYPNPTAGPSVISTQAGTAYTFVLGDAQTTVEGSNAAATTFTIPLNSSVAFPIGTVIVVAQTAAGQITIAGAAGVTLQSPGALVKTRVQHSTIGLVKRATDTWRLSGDLG